jgi:thiol-disulfide isomerase/thioredoxin
MRRGKSILIVVSNILIGSITCVAQTDLKPLNLGDKVPEKIWKTIPKKKSSELIILDFWATICGNCIAAFPKIEELQYKFGEKLQIVLINTSETEVEISKVFGRLNAKRTRDKWIRLPSSVPSLAGATGFQKIFPHKFLPHHVWLNNEGIVLAITEGENTNEANIRSALEDHRIDVEYKVDFFENKPLYLGEQETVDLGDFEQWSMFKKGVIEGVTTINLPRIIRDSVETYRGHAVRNQSMSEIIRTAIDRLSTYAPKFRFGKDKRRTIYEVKDINKLQWKREWDQTKSKSEKEIWEKENLYTYDILVPTTEVAGNTAAIYEQMISDINRFSNYSCSIEKRKVKCLILIRTSAADKIKTKGEKEKIDRKLNGDPYTFNNVRLTTLTYELFTREHQLSMSFSNPVLDETNYTGKIEIAFEKFPVNINELRKELQRYDLDLVEEEREIEVFVVRDKIKGTK